MAPERLQMLGGMAGGLRLQIVILAGFVDLPAHIEEEPEIVTATQDDLFALAATSLVAVAASDIPGACLSSGSLLILLGVVSPGGVFVVEPAGLEAAVQDPDEPVAELPQRGVVAAAASADGVGVDPRAGAGGQRAERLLVRGVGEAVVTGVTGQYDLLLARGAGDRGGAGVVLASSGVVVAVRVVAELTEHPGAEDLSQPGLGAVDLSVRVPATRGPRPSPAG